MTDDRGETFDRALVGILERVDEMRAGGIDPRQAFDQALAECQAREPRARATIDALVGILERAAALHEKGHAPDDAIAQASNECGASEALARVAAAAWSFDTHKGEASS